MNLKQVVRYGLAATGLLALVVGPAASASAQTFDYSQSTGWQFGSATTEQGPIVAGQAGTTTGSVEFWEPAVNPNPALHPGDNLPPPATYTTIGWGCDVNGLNCTSPAPPENSLALSDPFDNPSRSALYIEGQAGDVTVGGDWVNISHVEHNNRAITGRTLADVVVSSILRISTEPPTSNPQDLTILFEETRNRAPCPEPNPRGSVCDDFFQFDFTSFDDLEIIHDGETYTVEFRLFNFVNSTPIFDATTGTIYTAEGVISSVDVQMRILGPRVIPEPATLMLLGTGLIGVGIAAAKRRRSKI